MAELWLPELDQLVRFDGSIRSKCALERVLHQKLIKGLQMCPYTDCDGDTVMDSWDWERLGEAHPDYPEEPERDKVYPQYS